jgi:predicted SprT family Zn-dependent metalloprotease
LADDEVEQIILHEIAHGLVGVHEGHGRTWVKTARSLGYVGGRTIEIPEARISARWQGVCVRGHEVFRHRKPKYRAYCGTCANQGRRRELTWTDRGLGLIARG